MDNTFWATVALVLFFALIVYLKGFRRINASLDDRAKRIQTELEEARELKEEAKQQLAEYQRRRREAEQEAKEIVEGAKRESQAILADAKRKNEEFVQRRTAMAEQKIAQAETDAIAEVRSTAVDVAIAAATKIIAERNQNGNPQPMSASIDAVRSRLN
ncbi:F-type H+-transporting ATPase subunit b [Fulvimarina manganoxydans]|uniref:ATP synthase subunit b n=1 Tax=Fulvimarina manganoxydans TaxID=937218 RepID=A0A1W2D8W8_9HYPH|nr:F0F1 ATP synthase subunit B [Fulvimarina manganoxydans]MEE2951682.1 F0F1 ATP synthase subunit B [Pseudomonadota bacterium]SMC93684.1 F-type H+-transporting ATPase subunit b [Fulvimarina manganoxydans]